MTTAQIGTRTRKPGRGGGMTAEVVAIHSLDSIADGIRETWQQGKLHQVNAWECYFATGRLLAEARSQFTANQDYGHWFAGQGFAFSTEWARRLIALSARESEARELFATAVANGDLPGVNAVLSTLEGKTAHVSHNSGENEWYTPAAIITAARAVMGGIDLDPASTPAANDIVGAATFYTAADDGLSKPWAGRVWLNPPYAQPLMAMFAERVAGEYRAGRISEAIVLVNNATETDWFQGIADVASCICFPDGRIRYWHPDRNSSTPLQGQALLYLGSNVGDFHEAFGPLGFTVQRP